MKKYLKAEDLKGPITVTIRAVKKEIVDGRPRLVLYFEGRKKGLVLTREIAATITASYGRHPLVEEFFASPEGQEH